MRRRPATSAIALAALCLLLVGSPSTAAAQGRGSPSPSLRELLDACPPGGTLPPAGPPYRAPRWLYRGLPAPPSGNLADTTLLEERLRQIPTGDPARADALFSLGDAYLERAERGPAPTKGDERRRAVKVLAELIRSRPDYQRADHALQLLAHGLATEAEAQQDPHRSSLYQQTRQVYHQLIKRYPTSPFVAHGYTFFGDYYFEQGDMEAASRFYERVAMFPPPGNPFFAYATYRRGLCALDLGDREAAARHLRDAVAHLAAHPDAPDAAALDRRARAAICRAR